MQAGGGGSGSGMLTMWVVRQVPEQRETAHGSGALMFSFCIW